MILNYAANRGPKYDTQFTIASIRQLKPYKPHYILADRAYDTEPIRKYINEEVGAFDQIPLKTRAKTGHYQLNSSTIFWHDRLCTKNECGKRYICNKKKIQRRKLQQKHNTSK